MPAMKSPAEACFDRVRSRARTFKDLVPVRLAAAVPGVLVEVPGLVEGRVHGADDGRNNRYRHTQPAQQPAHGAGDRADGATYPGRLQVLAGMKWMPRLDDINAMLGGCS